MSERTDKIDSYIKQQLGQIMLEEIEWPLNCLVTITRVKTAADLKHALVYLSVIPVNKSLQITSLLERKVFRLQAALNKVVKSYHVPRIKFVLDFTEHQAEKIEKLIASTKA